MGINNNNKVTQIAPEEFTDLFKTDLLEPAQLFITSNRYKDEIAPIANIFNFMYWIT